MSAYDNMCVRANTSLVAHVCSRNVSTSNYRNKSLLRKSIGWARVCLLLLLVVSPVSANPVRSRRTSHHRASAEAAAAAAAAAAEAAAESANTALGVKLLLEVQKAVEQSSQHTLRSVDEQLLQFLGNSRSRSSSRQATMEDQPDDAGSSRSRRSTAHWSKPCTNLMKVTSNTQESLSFEIILAVAKAMSYMGDFKNNFSRDVLHMDWDELRDVQTNGITVPFIKSIPTINKAALVFDEQLQEAYEMMQRLAVGIEQVTLDQALYQGSFLQQFRIIENHIVTILCQLHYAMVHRNLSPSVSVTKEIMGEEYRDLEGESSRNMRDAVIVREYDAGLMHLKEVFSEFHKEAP